MKSNLRIPLEIHSGVWLWKVTSQCQVTNLALRFSLTIFDQSGAVKLPRAIASPMFTLILYEVS